MDRLTFTVPAVPPFRLDLTVWALRRRPDNAVDRWDGGAYRRTLVLQGSPLELEVVQSPPDGAQLRVTATGAGLELTAEPKLSAIVQRLLGLRIDLDDFYRVAAGDAVCPVDGQCGLAEAGGAGDHDGADRDT